MRASQEGDVGKFDDVEGGGDEDAKDDFAMAEDATRTRMSSVSMRIIPNILTETGADEDEECVSEKVN
jgi:hypothetical protein